MLGKKSVFRSVGRINFSALSCSKTNIINLIWRKKQKQTPVRDFGKSNVSIFGNNYILAGPTSGNSPLSVFCLRWQKRIKFLPSADGRTFLTLW